MSCLQGSSLEGLGSAGAGIFGERSSMRRCLHTVSLDAPASLAMAATLSPDLLDCRIECTSDMPTIVPSRLPRRNRRHDKDRP